MGRFAGLRGKKDSNGCAGLDTCNRQAIPGIPSAACAEPCSICCLDCARFRRLAESLPATPACLDGAPKTIDRPAAPPRAGNAVVWQNRNEQIERRVGKNGLHVFCRRTAHDFRLTEMAFSCFLKVSGSRAATCRPPFFSGSYL